MTIITRRKLDKKKDKWLLQEKDEKYRKKIAILQILEFIQLQGANKNIKDFNLFEFYKFVVKGIPRNEF